MCDYGVIGPICTHCGGTFPGAIAGRVPSPLTGLANDPERRYTYGGRVAHLLAYGIDYNAAPYTQAYCGYSPTWGAAWLGSGSQAEEDEANRLRLCKRCTAAADEVRGFVEGLQRDLGMTAPAKPQT